MKQKKRDQREREYGGGREIQNKRVYRKNERESVVKV